jgi:3'-5' exoribonuclease
MAQETVAQLKSGQEFVGILWLVSGQVRQTKTGDPFWEGTFQDATGSIQGKVWDSAEGQKGRVEAFLPALKPGPVKVKARVESYKDVLQLTLSKARPAPEADPALFAPGGKRSREEMLAEFESVLLGIGDPDFGKLLGAFKAHPEVFPLFVSAPAAKAIHHAWVGGLFEHSLALARNVKALAPCYPGLNVDLLLCGCFVHDVGKSFEISSSPGFEYTTHGKLLGHIYMGAKFVEDLCLSLEGFPSEKRRQIVHLVLSHQGERSDGFGSPVDPQTPEAIFFHQLDNLDAKVQSCLTSLDKAEGSATEGEFTSARESPLRKSYYRVRPPGAERPEGPPHTEPATELKDDGDRDPQPRLW